MLPPGIYPADWEEIVERFGWNERRRRLLKGLQQVLDDLRAAGCREVWLDGSFVTTKELPGDFDLTWNTDGVDVSSLHPALQELRHPRTAQKRRYGGDILPNVREAGSGMPFLDFFQQDTTTGEPRGVVAVGLEDWS